MHGLFNEVFVLLGMVLFVGLYAGKMARRVRLPSLIGFMLLGVVLGPSALKWFGGENLEQLSFLTEMALGFVAFAIGAELSMKSLRKQGWGIVSIILAESFAAFFLVFGAVALLTRNIPLSLLFGALAPASAPAGTVAVIQEYKARGSLTQALYAVVGFDDGLAILIFGFAAALAKLLLLKELGVSGMPSGFWGTVQTPLVEIVGSLAVGLVLGLLFSALIRRMNAPKDLLILSVAVVFVGTGLANHFHLSLILTNMVIG
ncbi:MAG: cation:proton antiporter, partial [Lentisphaeria bacterium]|nr:cation:proton antiporter [Lentisphaeria bacterium]